MINSSSINNTDKRVNTPNFIELLNFIEIEIKLSEAKMEKLVVSQRGNKMVMKQVERFQNQFLIQQNNINDLKQKVRRFWMLAGEDLKLEAWQDRRPYQLLSTEVQAFLKRFNELLHEFNAFTRIWLPF